QTHAHKELPRLVIIQGAACIGVLFFQPLDHFQSSLLFCHLSFSFSIYLSSFALYLSSSSRSTSSFSPIQPSRPLPLKNPPFLPMFLSFLHRETINRIRKVKSSASIVVKGCSSTATTSTFS